MDPRSAVTLPRRAGVPRASGDGPPCNVSGASTRTCSPRERGWTSACPGSATMMSVFPARAGMDPSSAACPSCRRRVPRASGDGPEAMKVLFDEPMCSPRERGWTQLAPGRTGYSSVFPARAGMDPRTAFSRHVNRSVPRASGDGPAPHDGTSSTARCSPRKRGWTGFRAHDHTADLVFPARAGMDLTRRTASTSRTSVPRASGDGPGLLLLCTIQPACSPRERGWTWP